MYYFRARLQMSGKLDIWVGLISFPENIIVEVKL